MKKLDRAVEIARILRNCQEEELEEKIITVFCPTQFGMDECRGCSEAYCCQEGWNEETEE